MVRPPGELQTRKAKNPKVSYAVAQQKYHCWSRLFWNFVHHRCKCLPQYFCSNLISLEIVTIVTYMDHTFCWISSTIPYNDHSLQSVTYCMVGNFRGSKFSWFGELRRFCGFIFSCHTYSNHLVIRIAKIQ